MTHSQLSPLHAVPPVPNETAGPPKGILVGTVRPKQGEAWAKLEQDRTQPRLIFAIIVAAEGHADRVSSPAWPRHNMLERSASRSLTNSGRNDVESAATLAYAAQPKRAHGAARGSQLSFIAAAEFGRRSSLLFLAMK
jgi:hypothetical protein